MEALVNLAKKSLTPEQQEEYRKIGEYMYTDINYRQMEVGTKVKQPTIEDLSVYAIQGLKSGLHPRDLTPNEIRSLRAIKGESWYEEFGYKKDDVPEASFQIGDSQSKSQGNISRQERRLLERKKEKMEKRNGNG